MRYSPGYFRSVFILLVTGLPLCFACGQSTPDPKLLLQGAESARLQIPPSSLKLRITYSDPVTTNSTVAVVDFDGDIRGFEYLGEGETNSGWSAVFDGSRAITYEERLKQVAYRSLATDQNELILFDPRLLGLISAYAWDESLQVALPWRTESGKFELIGREEVGGRSAWHVRFSFGQDIPVDLWIDDANGFRVYQKIFNAVQIFSYYENNNYPWLPSRVVSKAYSHLNPLDDEIPRYTKEIQILEARTNNFPKSRWTLEGMKLKPGTDVIDLKLSRSIGRWNGKRMDAERDVRPETRPGRWTYVLMAILFVGPGIYIWRRSKRRSEP